MVLSKGRKIILIAAIVVVVLAAAFFGYKLYSDAQEKLDDAIDPVLKGYALSFADPYDPDTVDEFIERYWNPVKDKSSFQKKFVKQLQEQVIDISFQNAGLDADDRIKNEYYDEITNAQGTILDMMPFLQYAGYEEENLKACLREYYVRLAENERAELEGAEADSAQAEELNAADSLLGALDEVRAFNDASADYYQIDENEIIPLEEVGDHYRQAIELAQKADDIAVFAKALSAATSSPLLKEQTFADSDQIADFLIADDAVVYTMRNGVGGYYDTHEIDESGVQYYGDFAAWSYTTSSHKYDTSAFTPGLWSALTPGQRAEIQSGNSSTTYHYYYLCGAELDSTYDSDIPELAQGGYGYAFCNPDGSVLFVSAKYAKYYGAGGNYEMQGDFTEQVEQAAEVYGAGGAQSGSKVQNRQGILQTAMTALTEGDADAVVQAFLQYTAEGTDLDAAIEFVEAAVENDMAAACADIIYPYLDLSDQDIAKFEGQLEELL